MKVEEFRKKYPTYFKKRNNGNKYKAKQALIDGMKFDSQSEGDYYLQLKLQQQAGLIKSFETQVKEELYAYEVHIGNYYVDFKIIHNDDSIEFLEHKGMATDLWRWKYKMLEAKYKNDPNVKCTINWYKAPYKYKVK